MKFIAPEGFELPEGVVEGEDFEVLAAFRMTTPGSLELVSIQGIPVDSSEEEMEDEEEPPAGPEPRSMVDALRSRAYSE